MKYDTAYINGKIFTADSERPYASAMAVKDGKIVWVGESAQLPEMASGDVTVVNLGAKRVLPGFVDGHMHAIMLANCCKSISALPPEIYSIEDLIEAIKIRRAGQEPGEWILGWGYDEGKLAEGRTPTRWDLDKGCSDAPVEIVRTCAHMSVLNSAALKIVGITKDTPDPEGGRIGRDENGEPNGILYETAKEMVNEFKPEKTIEVVADNLKDLDDILLSQGITTCSDMGEFGYCDYEAIFGRAMEKGFKNRVACYYMWDDVKDKDWFTITENQMDTEKQVRIAGLKLIGDGSVSGRTAWCDKPYLEAAGQADQRIEEEYGLPVCSEKDIDDALAFSKEHKCQLSIHCMGAKAIERAVDHTWKEENWLDNSVPAIRLEHVAMPTMDSIKKAARSGMGWITQPIFMYAEIESYMKNLSKERIQECYPIADFIYNGIRLSFSTDAPSTAWATPSEPFACIKGAVTRKAWDGTDCGQRHKVDIESAIRLYTAESAPMLGYTDVGQLKEGFVADFIVLDKDVLEIPADEIDQVKVEATYIAGNKVYSRV